MQKNFWQGQQRKFQKCREKFLFSDAAAEKNKDIMLRLYYSKTNQKGKPKLIKLGLGNV